MHPLNLALFDALAAGFSPSPAVLRFASAIALGSSWACAAVLAWAAWRRVAERPCVLAVLAAGGAASLISQEIAAAVGLPRPFMMGLSPAHVPHGLRAGLPSTHASVMFAMAFTLLLRRPMRDVGLVILAAAIATCWARVYVGIHFPFDVAAGALLGAGIAAALLALQAAAPRLAPQAAAALARPLRALADGRAGPCLVLVFVLAAAWVGSNTPGMIGPGMLEEDGPVEKGTVLLYLAAVLCLLMVRLESLSRLDRTAIGVLLLAFAAREADWHLAHFGAGIFEAPLPRMFAGAAILAGIAAAAGWLARRAWSASRAMRSWRQWRPEAATSLTFVAVIGAAIILDQLPASPAAPPDLFTAGSSSSAALRGYLMLSFEEILELALPVLALLAILQARLSGSRDAAASGIERSYA
ncbi:phosphatase PAP2 family protein [Variovorax paradoxus]|uniref:phosphatase PAP2 family protein n=1 Tax=Variovorax paradoxus TaxID=34073 RepID=UPI002786AC36|nr:phosphatase PAP2 family protein [Variovorax paradoxus]MDQ0590021.1 membrane-associated phospholipid phosphatase [Variovorax paradoxus]